jgi:hypothetical protein
MALTSYAKNCTAKKAGNSNKIFLVKVGDINEITFDTVTGEVEAITMGSGKKFAELNADLHSVIYTSEGQGSTGYFSNQSLIAKFSKKTTTLEKTINELVDGVVCGLVAIRVDNNRNAWLSGMSADLQEGKSLPWDSIEDNFTSGESIEDFEEGDMYTVTLKRTSGIKEIRLENTLRDEFVDGTSTLVNWIV